MREVVSTDDAPAAVGAYSQATTNGDLVFTAGQLPATPDGELLADAAVGRQTERALSNVFAILESEGAGAEDVLKVTVYLRDADDFDAMNDAYAAFFEGRDAAPPARSAVEAPPPVAGADVEIEAVATLR
ncbi:MAG: Rid family detoxifying hydrolase [Haloferacaceae archaeon]